jgi:hypothetical protein
LFYLYSSRSELTLSTWVSEQYFLGNDGWKVRKGILGVSGRDGAPQDILFGGDMTFSIHDQIVHL